MSQADRNHKYYVDGLIEEIKRQAAQLEAVNALVEAVMEYNELVTIDLDKHDIDWRDFEKRRKKMVDALADVKKLEEPSNDPAGA